MTAYFVTKEVYNKRTCQVHAKIRHYNGDEHSSVCSRDDSTRKTWGRTSGEREEKNP